MLSALLLLLLAPEPTGRITHAPINETSGIEASDRFEDVFWVHNDSGDSARFFAIRPDGEIVAPPWASGSNGVSPQPFAGIRVSNATNIDWEDIAYDGENLYLADVGNNANARRDLVVYVVPEPNPELTETTTAQRAIPVSFADQASFPPQGTRAFDCEAVFYLRGALWFLTKHRSGIGMPVDATALYRLDLRRAHDHRPNPMRPLQTRTGLGGWVTAADVSPDGRTLAVLTHLPVTSVWLFDLRGAGDQLLSKPIRQVRLGNLGQAEALTFETDTSLLVANEQREIVRVRLDDQ